MQKGSNSNNNDNNNKTTLFKHKHTDYEGKVSEQQVSKLISSSLIC